MWCFAGEEQLVMYGKRLTSVVPEGNETFFVTFPVLILDISTTPWKINMEHNHRGWEDQFPF